jgi:predicted amidohydrolase
VIRGEIRYFNTLGVAGPNGFVTKYRKRALYYIDECYADAGKESVVLRTPYGDFGLMVCMDANDYAGDYYEQYTRQGIDSILLTMDWDEDPNGPSAARSFFRGKAKANGVDIYASDASAWDGTGKYPKSGAARERNGLAPVAIGVDGFSLHSGAP